MNRNSNQLLLATKDGVQMKVNSKLKDVCGLLNNGIKHKFSIYIKYQCFIFSDMNPQESIKLDLIESKTMNLIIEYFEQHKFKKPSYNIPVPLNTKDFSKIVDQWDYQYLTKLSDDDQYNLFNATDYLNCQILFELLCAYQASKFKGKTLKEVKEQYGITESLSPQLEEQLKQEYQAFQ